MKKILYIAVIAGALFSACNKMTDINTDPTQFVKVMPEGSMNTAIKATPSILAQYPVNKYWEYANWVSLTGRYDCADVMWQTSYVTILNNLQQILNNYGSDTAFNNRIQIARIYKAYIQSILVGAYGPIASSQANDPNRMNSIMFDKEDSVYSNILNTLKDAAARMNTAKTTDKLPYDVIYNGDLVKWKKFANTLRLKIALRSQLLLGNTALDAAREAMADEANLIGSEAEAAKIQFDNTTNGNQNPYYIGYSGKANVTAPTGISFPKMSDYMLDFLRSYKDPRINVYFDSVAKATDRYILIDTLASTADDSLRIVSYPIPHWGIPKSTVKLSGWTASLANQVDPIGNSNTFSNVTTKVWSDPARPMVILGFAETLFLKAEAAQLGLGGAQTADAYYYAGIDANFLSWGMTLSAANTYKQVDGVKWGSSSVGKTFRNYIGISNADIPDGDINKIYAQAWMNYFPDGGFDAWCMIRRTWSLNFPPHTNPSSPGALYSDVPFRMFYPSTLVSLNPEGYADAMTQLGLVGTSSEAINNTVALKFMKPHETINWNDVPAQYDYSLVQRWYGTTVQELDAASKASGFTWKIIATYKP